MHNYIVINEDNLRDPYALFLTLAAFFFNAPNEKHIQEDFHNDFPESYKD